MISQYKIVDLSNISINYNFKSSWWTLGTTVDCHVCPEFE